MHRRTPASPRTGCAAGKSPGDSRPSRVRRARPARRGRARAAGSSHILRRTSQATDTGCRRGSRRPASPRPGCAAADRTGAAAPPGPSHGRPSSGRGVTSRFIQVNLGDPSSGRSPARRSSAAAPPGDGRRPPPGAVPPRPAAARRRFRYQIPRLPRRDQKTPPPPPSRTTRRMTMRSVVLSMGNLEDSGSIRLL